MASKSLGEPEQAAETLSLIGNAKRLEIFIVLFEEGEVPVGTLAEKVGLSQSALSQHLAKLRANRLVETRRDRQMIYYRTESTVVLEVMNVLSRYFDISGKKNGNVDTLTTRDKSIDVDVDASKRRTIARR